MIYIPHVGWVYRQRHGSGQGCWVGPFASLRQAAQSAWSNPFIQKAYKRRWKP
jgi:hypothetical protein